jgi:TusA-related sulfurtransferase
MDGESRQPAGKYVLDLTREVWSGCLLIFKSHFDRMEEGCMMEVLLTDPDVINSVDMMMRHLDGRIIRIEKKIDHCRVLIQRQVLPAERL